MLHIFGMQTENLEEGTTLMTRKFRLDVAWAALAATFLMVTSFFLVSAAMADGPTYRAPRAAAPVQPAEVPAFNYTGPYIGGGIGGGIALGELNAPNHYDLNIDSLSAYALPLGDVRIGFDWQMAGTPFVVGVFGGHQFGELEFNASAGSQFVNATIDREQWYGGARGGLVFANRTLLYLGYLYQEADLNITTNDGSVPSTLSPHNALGGIEFPLAGGFTFAAEYKYTLPEKNEVFSGVTINTDVHEGTVRLNWRPVGGLF